MDHSIPPAHSLSGANGTSTPLRNGESKDDYYKPFPPNYFAPKPGHQALDIGIIGAGIAGLTAAVALIFERSKFANEIGAAIHMCPNATRILSYYGFDYESGLATPLRKLSLLDAHTLDVLRSVEIPDTQQRYGAPWFLFHRVDLHSQLRKMATEPRPNTNAVAKINLLSEVADIDLEGTITLANGECVKKDLVVVADGVRSKFPPKVVGDEVSTQVSPTGTAVYRFLIPTEDLLKDPQTRPYFDQEDFSGTIARLKDARLVWYPCRHGALQNFGFFVPDTISGFDDEVWNIPASREEFLKSTSELHPDLQAVCSKAEDLKLFRLCMRKKPIPTLTRGNVVLIGDASHPMLPHQAQGGGMAVEDGAALGVLFSNLSSKEEVHRRLDHFQQLRFNRVSAIQILSSVGQDEIHKVIDSAERYFQGPVPTTPDGLNEYNFTANVMRDAVELLQQDRPMDL